MAAPHFDRELASKVLVEATLVGDKAAAAKHKISQRTLDRWRKRLESDPKLAEAVRNKEKVAEKDWAESLPSAISKAIEFLAKAADSANTGDPSMVHSVAGALKILTDVAMSRRIVDARISRQAGPTREENREVAPQGQRNVVPLQRFTAS